MKHSKNMNDTTILFLPGLTGDSKCEYVRATSLAVQNLDSGLLFLTIEELVVLN